MGEFAPSVFYTGDKLWITFRRGDTLRRLNSVSAILLLGGRQMFAQKLSGKLCRSHSLLPGGFRKLRFLGGCQVYR